MYRHHARHKDCISTWFSTWAVYLNHPGRLKKKKCLDHALRDSDEIVWERDLGICNSIKIIHYDQVGFISGMHRFFSICKSISVIHHINKLMNKTR